MKYLYLDTSALIDLAEFKTRRYWLDIDHLLHDGSHTLFLSTTHMYEFSKGRKENDYTAIYLDELPYIKWVIPPWCIWKEEVANALSYCLTDKKNKFKVYYNLFFEMYTTINPKYRKLKYHIEQPTSAGKAIDFFKKDDVYKETEEVAKKCTQMVRQMREKSLIYQSWETALRMHVRDLWPNQTSANLQIQPDDTLIDKVIKVADLCMPSLVFVSHLRHIKFDVKEHVEPNDFIDEFHASYVPYCDVIMHDKRACKRIRQMESVFVMKFAASPKELLQIL